MGLSALLDPIKFDCQQDLGLPGLPISHAEVVSNTEEAKDILDISGKDLARSKQKGFPSPLFDRYPYAMSSPTRFFEKYGPEIRQSQQIDAFYNANLVDITLIDSLAAVKGFRVRNSKNQTTTVSSHQYV